FTAVSVMLSHNSTKKVFTLFHIVVNNSIAPSHNVTKNSAVTDHTSFRNSHTAIPAILIPSHSMIKKSLMGSQKTYINAAAAAITPIAIHIGVEIAPATAATTPAINLTAVTNAPIIVISVGIKAIIFPTTHIIGPAIAATPAAITIHC